MKRLLMFTALLSLPVAVGIGPVAIGLDTVARIVSRPLIGVPQERRAGFVAIRSPHAAQVVSGMRSRGVFADARGEILRLGPAPYLSDTQLVDGVDALGETARGL